MAQWVIFLLEMPASHVRPPDAFLSMQLLANEPGKATKDEWSDGTLPPIGKTRMELLAPGFVLI